MDVDVELTGPWRAAPATDDLRRRSIEPEFLASDTTDLVSWHPVDVPGHWRRSAAFADNDGPLLYRCDYELDPPPIGRRRWLTFDGLFYQGDVWLDGGYLGDPEGYFEPHSFDISALSRLGREHAVVIEVACPPQPRSTGRKTLTGAFQGGVAMPPGWNPGGIWGPVRVHDTGPVRITALRVLCRDADERRAHLRVTAHLDSDDHRTVTLTSFVDGTDVHHREHPLAAGENEVEWGIDILDPRLWWPHQLGEQLLTSVAVTVGVDGTPSDRAERSTGLRQVRWDGWECSINEERLFLRGANLLPSVPWPAEHGERGAADVQLARDLGLNAVRFHQHIPSHATLEAADRLGMLVLQDFPLIGRHARSVRSQALRQAMAAVDHFGHHPSIVAWFAHDDPVVADLEAPPDTVGGKLRRLARQQLPTWNKSVLDRWVSRTFETADPTRATIANSGAVPHVPQFSGSDSHLWYGWRTPDTTRLDAVARWLPMRLRFVSEFGSVSVPEHLPLPISQGIEAIEARWPAPDWHAFAEAFEHEQSTLLERFPPESYATYDDWAAATRAHQAEIVKRSIETLRRAKYEPCGGFCVAYLADPTPAISAAVFDSERSPKPAAEAVRAACLPIIVMATPPATAFAGEPLEVDVHVVNDERHDLPDITVTATVSWASDRRAERFGGTVEADSVMHVTTLAFDVPDTLGTLTIELVAANADGATLATNRYGIAVTRV